MNEKQGNYGKEVLRDDKAKLRGRGVSFFYSIQISICLANTLINNDFLASLLLMLTISVSGRAVSSTHCARRAATWVASFVISVDLFSLGVLDA